MIGPVKQSSVLEAVLTAPEAAKRYGLSRRHIIRLVSSRKVPGRKADGAWLIDAAALQKFLSKPRLRGRPKKK